MQIDRTVLLQARPEIEALINRLESLPTDVPEGAAEQRRHPRQQVRVGVTLQRLNDNFEPVGEPIHATTRDLSVSGIGLLLSRPIEEAQWAVTIDAAQNTPEQPTEALLCVLRCRQLNDALFEVGGEFVFAED